MLGTTEDQEKLALYQEKLAVYCKRHVFECPSYSGTSDRLASFTVKVDEQMTVGESGIFTAESRKNGNPSRSQMLSRYFQLCIAHRIYLQADWDTLCSVLGVYNHASPFEHQLDALERHCSFQEIYVENM